METKLTQLLGIKYPIIQGGMAWVSESKLTSAVSNAGGAGIIACGGRQSEWVKDEIHKARRMTDKPFGINIMLMAPNKDEMVELACLEKVDFVTLGAGNPVPYIDKLKGAGVRVIPVVPNVKLAKRVEAAGADAIVVEGMEAGGHIGTQTTLALMTNVLPEVNIPVVVAGGIADGRGIAAAVLMGAAGVQMGTRFLLASECAMHPKAKEKIIMATDTDSVVTGYSRNHGVRGIKNSFTDKYLEMERSGAPTEELDSLAKDTNRKAAVEGDIENGVVLAGQSLVPLKKIQPAGDIMEEIMAQARSVLAGAAKLLSAN